MDHTLVSARDSGTYLHAGDTVEQGAEVVRVVTQKASLPPS